MRTHLGLAASLALLLQPMPAIAWGKTGHRVVGAIAGRHIHARARRAVRAILGTESLAEAANWPDFMRSSPDPVWKSSGPYHYVTVPQGRTYDEVGAPPEGDAVTKLRDATATLRDPHSDRAARQAALRWVVHLVGDLHQPLHAGNGTDKGANDVKVTFFGQPSNLHSVWDSGLIDEQQLSYTEWTDWLDRRITPSLARQWRDIDPRTWIAESAALRDRIYPADPAIGYSYVFQHEPEVEQRLEQGGIRLAAYLDWVFAKHPRPNPAVAINPDRP